jgi:hypothetical protein
MQSSHSLDAIGVTFDDEHAVMILPATLAQHLGLRELFDQQVDLGDAPGRAHVGHKAMTVIHSALAGRCHPSGVGPRGIGGFDHRHFLAQLHLGSCSPVGQGGGRSAGVGGGRRTR